MIKQIPNSPFKLSLLLAGMSVALAAQAGSLATPELSASSQASLTEIIAKTRQAQAAAKPVTAKHEPKREREYADVYYLVSLSMPSAVLKELHDNLRPKEVIVLRGSVKSAKTKRTLPPNLTWLIAAGKMGDVKSEVTIDPMKFRECKATLAPTTCIRTAEGYKAIAGTTSATYARQAQPGTPVGRTWPIIEVDALEQVNEMYAAIKKNPQLKDRSKVTYPAPDIKLPAATAAAAFSFDPSIATAKAITVGQKTLAPAGKITNPLAGQRGFAFAYVVIDATVSGQVATARSLVSTLTRSGKRVKVVVARMKSRPVAGAPAAVTPQEIKVLSQQVGAPITFADENFIKRLRVQRLPSVIESRDGRVLVNEVRGA